ncbi:putative tricarboxylic transport membrane protein [Anaerovirgula multivorans]|uniref:Putative tricarboxylic transport membrane protein n=1 Tax=Anaerovirgula multivorans TaxID=312168 RepID=A0A239HWP5_9FIRM|nr:tripartite tricarboxylate transporter TctB family protein [Anaerovirgula multivorans]SNS85757.1 putative tricarboxylic transport membrane protein [Anaerovirgula multivorans]
MKLKKYSELIFGLLILAFGIFYFILTIQLPRKDTIDATFIPYILSAFMGVLGILQLSAGIKASKKFKEEEYVAENLDHLTVIKIIALIVIYIAFLQPIGFLICTAVFLVLGFILLTPVGTKINYVQYITISVVATVLIYFSFRNGLHLMLPEGILRLGR